MKLKLDITGGVRSDAESALIDESLRSVDEEVQEVTAVRLVVKNHLKVLIQKLHKLSRIKFMSSFCCNPFS